MKKVFSLLAVLAVTVFMASSVWAALPVAQKAYANFATEELAIEFELYTYDSNKTGFTFGTNGVYKDADKANSIAFDLSDVAVGSADSSFAPGTVFARVTSNLTKHKAGTNIFMFTKNSTASGDYQAKAAKVVTEDNTTTSTYSGLIRKGNGTTYADGDHAALEMHFAKASEAVYPTEMSTKGDAYGDKYLVDCKDSNYGDGAYAIIGTSGVNGGIWCGDASATQTDYSQDADMIIFFGARFDNVFAGDQYGTECITILTTKE